MLNAFPHGQQRSLVAFPPTRTTPHASHQHNHHDHKESRCLRLGSCGWGASQPPHARHRDAPIPFSPYVGSRGNQRSPQGYSTFGRSKHKRDWRCHGEAERQVS